MMKVRGGRAGVVDVQGGRVGEVDVQRGRVGGVFEGQSEWWTCEEGELDVW